MFTKYFIRRVLNTTALPTSRPRFKLKPSYNISMVFVKTVHGPNMEEFLYFLKNTERLRNSTAVQCLKQTNSSATELQKGKRNGKKYTLSTLLYPSGDLNMDQIRVCTFADAMARFYHMRGYEVIFPVGWERPIFSYRANNEVAKEGESPSGWISNSISNMKEQLNSLGCCFDWSRELITCDANYYKWTQLLFLKLLNAGLAYRKETIVNWDPVDRTVLSKEQISETGISWQSGAKVEKKVVKQWFIKTTRYAENLYDALQALPDNSSISAIQKHWIGECTNHNIELKLHNINNKNNDCFDVLPVGISNPERLINVSFLGVSSGHFLDQEKFVDYTKNNIKVLNLCGVEPITRNRIPIIVSDELQFEPDCQVYTGIPLLNDKDHSLCAAFGFTENNGSIKDYLVINSGAGIKEIILNKVKALGCGVYKTSAKLEDWLISRQRYWGTPIPIIYCDSCGIVPVPEEQLPVQLPEMKSLTAKGTSILRDSKDWYNCDCPSCGGAAVRETDTMDTFMDSSWYFLCHQDVDNSEEMFSKERSNYSVPVDLFIGRSEHAELNLYYFRFIQKFLKDQGLVSHAEPVAEILTLAGVRGNFPQPKEAGKYFKLATDDSASPLVKNSNQAATQVKYEDLSGIQCSSFEAQNVLNEFSIDATRFAILTDTNPGKVVNWAHVDMSGCLSFLKKLYISTKDFVESRKESVAPICQTSKLETDSLEKRLLTLRNIYTLQITYHYENYQLPKVRQSLQDFLDATVNIGRNTQFNGEYEQCIRSIIIMLSPICPHLCVELWDRLNYMSSQDIADEVPYFIRAGHVLLRHSLLPWIASKDAAAALARHRPEVTNALNGSSILEMEFSRNFRAVVNFITRPRKNIFRDIDCEVKGSVVRTVQIPQQDYITLTKDKVAEIVSNDIKLRRALVGYSVNSFEFYYKPHGRSKIVYNVKKAREDTEGLPRRGRRK